MFDAHHSINYWPKQQQKHASCSMFQLNVLVIEHFVQKFHLSQIPNTQFDL